VLLSSVTMSMGTTSRMQPATWSPQELQSYALTTSIESSYSSKYSEHNPIPGADHAQVSVSTLILSCPQGRSAAHKAWACTTYLL
jgi:hypothetical protein